MLCKTVQEVTKNELFANISDALKKTALVCFEFWQVVPQPCPDSVEWGALGRTVLVGLGCPKPR